MKDFYQVLGVPRTASAEEIKKAYRRLAKQYHPDVNKGDKSAENRFKEISEAYNVLSDPEQKKKFDMFGQAYDKAAGGGGFQGYQQASGQGFNQANFEGFGGDLGDIMKDLFDMGGVKRTRYKQSRTGPRRQQPVADGQDMITDVEISFVDAAKGTQRAITIKRGEKTEKLTVKIPAGVDNGSKVRVSGKGGFGYGGGKPGDLFLRIHVTPHPEFWREGADVFMELPVTVYDAVLGGSVTVPTLEGTAKMKIPSGTSSGQKFRLKNKGTPVLGKKSSKGDQYVIVQIAPPKKTNAEERHLYEELATRFPYKPK